MGNLAQNYLNLVTGGYTTTRYNREAAQAARNTAASGLTGSYADRAAANPYGNAEFTPNFWQRIGESWFGDYSARDKFYQEQDQSAMEYINQLLDAQHQEEYNSEGQTAERLRAAGLNPDLQGLEQGSDAVSAVPDDTPPGGMPNEGINPAEMLGNGLIEGALSFMNPTNILSSGVSLYGAVLAGRKNKSDIELNELSGILGALGKMPDIAAGLAPTESVSVDDSGTVRLDAAQVDAAIEGLGVSKRTSQRLKQLAGMTSYDKNGNTTTAFQNAYRKLREGSLESGSNIAKYVSSPGYSENLQEWSQGYLERYGAFQEEILSLTLEAQRQQAKLAVKLYGDDVNQQRYESEMADLQSQEEIANYTRDFYNNLDPNLAADSQKKEEYARGYRAIQSKLESQVAAAIEKRFADEIQAIQDNPHFSKEFKRDQINGVLLQRAEWMNARLSETTAAGKVLGDTDKLDAAVSAGKGILDLVGGLGLVKGLSSKQAPVQGGSYTTTYSR